MFYERFSRECCNTRLGGAEQLDPLDAALGRKAAQAAFRTDGRMVPIKNLSMMSGHRQDFFYSGAAGTRPPFSAAKKFVETVTDRQCDSVYNSEKSFFHADGPLPPAIVPDRESGPPK